MFNSFGHHKIQSIILYFTCERQKNRATSLIIIIIIIEIFIQVKAFSMPKGTVINKGPVFKKVYTLLKMKVIAVWVRYNVKLSNLILKCKTNS